MIDCTYFSFCAVLEPLRRYNSYLSSTMNNLWEIYHHRQHHRQQHREE
nr:MAG TPA: hypothetical protein [Caudoviricetes sp.]